MIGLTRAEDERPSINSSPWASLGGSWGLAGAQDFGPEVILLDILMPDKDPIFFPNSYIPPKMTLNSFQACHSGKRCRCRSGAGVPAPLEEKEL